MRPRRPAVTNRFFLGVECGGTRTHLVLVDSQGRLRREHRLAGCANLRLVDDRDLIRLFRRIRSACAGQPRPAAVGIGMAGARTAADRQRIRKAAAKIWPAVPCAATNDLETALAARGDADAPPAAARVLVLSGTGSCCFGRNRAGRSLKVGGWGHILGDQGSGYDLGITALKAVTETFDADGRWPSLGGRLLRSLQLNTPEELVGWAHAATKADVASLAPTVFAARAAGDPLARELVMRAAKRLAIDAVACARRLAAPRNRVAFVLAGGVLLNQTSFAAAVARRIRSRWPRAEVRRLETAGAFGAALLGAGLLTRVPPSWSPTAGRSLDEDPEAATSRGVVPFSAGLPLTELRNPRSMDLDRLSLAGAIRLMLAEDKLVPRAVLAQAAQIEAALRLIVAAFRRGGRLFYVGAGTSGRLGVLDASECPPTFGTSPGLIQGILAGGQSALWQSIEGAEDDAEAGAEAIRFRAVRARDVVLGIAASGRTPFVWGALTEARRRSARTVLLCFNPRLRFAPGGRPDVVIAPRTGPEILTGSTRLKAGTATKLVLNILTTLAMVRLGKVRSNLMVDVNPANAKLRDRAIRIVVALTGAGEEAARQALRNSGWVVKHACRRLAGRARRG